MDLPDIAPIRTIELTRLGQDDRGLRHFAADGHLVRVIRGVYVRRPEWEALSARDRHALRVVEHVSRLSGLVVASHWSAAALWGLPVVDCWPDVTEVIDTGRATTVTNGSLRRRPGPLAPHEFIWTGRISVTTAARTAVDIALATGFETAVVVFDAGLRAALFSASELEAVLARRAEAKRRKAVKSAIDFASAAAGSVGESISRVSLSVRGLQAPLLQEPFFDASGKIGEVDFFWPGSRLVGEFDGDVKYTDPSLMNGLTVAQVIRNEKARQRRLENHPDVRRVVRWGWAIARDPEALARILLDAGAPRINPRKRRPRNAAA